MDVEKIVYLFIEKRCNENCAFCVNKRNTDDHFGYLSTEDVKSTIAQYVTEGVTIVNFTGGEPTLRDDLPEIIQYAEQFDSLKSLCIITNGVRLADEGYLKKLVEADVNHKLSFSVSLHSHKKAISEVLTRSVNTFEKTIEGINNIIKYHKNIGIYHVITSKNYNDLFSFCCFLQKQFPQIKYLVFAYPLYQGEAVSNNWIYVRLSLLKPYLVKALKFLESYGYFVKMANCGLIPLCVLPGFEEKAIDPRSFNVEKVIGTKGKKYFQDFEYDDTKWINQHRNKAPFCKKCVLNTICQGVLKEYIKLFRYDGMEPVCFKNFLGSKIENNLQSQNDLAILIKTLKKGKLNLIKLMDFYDEFLQLFLDYARDNQVILVIIDKQENIIYPQASSYEEHKAN